jgi:Protochlamydia outer membrane protein
MKPILYRYFFCMALLYTQLSFAQNKDRVQIDFGSGYQQENFHWSIAGDIQGQNPNVYSELKWRDLQGTVLSAHLNANIWSNLFISGGYSHSYIHSGKVNDTDYGSDNRTNPVYNQNFDDNKGYSDMWNAGLAWQLLKDAPVSVRPELGYAQSRQDLYLLDLSGQYANLNSSYAAKWKGPYLKLNATWHIIPKLNLNADVQYTQANYHANADWNLITQFQHPVSYTHSANGYGINTNATLTYNITPYLGVYIGGGYFNWQTGNGTDRLYLTNGQTDDTQMNGAFSNGYKLVAGLCLKY